ncbi:MAG: OmpA family protein [Desulfobulbaceae bacterium]|nr:OmpA family protein [Desulfobulbaceae bacterium]HIJ78890.1 OmpA family protein [Deltaproteobacteria bacterium]
MAEDEPKKVKCAKGAPGWMCTFADMMSLLLCFFVLLLSFANMDEVKFAKMNGSMKDAFGVQRSQQIINPVEGTLMISPNFDSTPFNVRQELMDIAEEFADSGLVEAAELEDSIVIRVKEQLAFDSGKAVLRPEFIKLLDKIGKVAALADANIIVSGHSDNVVVRKENEFGTNWGLSAARAVAVVEYWAGKYKIPASRMSAAGFADGKPIANNNTAEGRAKNRRVEFTVRPNTGGRAFTGLKELQ